MVIVINYEKINKYANKDYEKISTIDRIISKIIIISH